MTDLFGHICTVPLYQSIGGQLQALSFCLFLVGVVDLVSVVVFVIGRTDYKRRVLEEEEANSAKLRRN